MSRKKLYVIIYPNKAIYYDDVVGEEKQQNFLFAYLQFAVFVFFLFCLSPASVLVFGWKIVCCKFLPFFCLFFSRILCVKYVCDAIHLRTIHIEKFFCACLYSFWGCVRYVCSIYFQCYQPHAKDSHIYTQTSHTTLTSSQNSLIRDEIFK